uniref:Magnesium transporter MgtE intracellular domain-containing protein n=1 Tax=Magnetococcus massalia (strain MO-1) TaxID=451514 RepID=A0A1S7LND7_MAGMO|nr:Conserved exported protein of unknown function [Candidatus Magnetococcus massalia]
MDRIKRAGAGALFGVVVALLPLSAAWGAQDQNGVARDPVQLLDELEKRRNALDARAAELDLREKELNRLQEQVAKRTQALQMLRQEVRKDILEEKKINTDNIAKLARVYASMKPKVAAQQLKDLERNTAIKVLKVMKEKVAAKIFDKMNPEDGVPLADAIGMTLQQKRQQRMR